MKAEVMTDEDIVRNLELIGSPKPCESVAKLNDLLRENLVDSGLLGMTKDGRLLTEVVKESMALSSAYQQLEEECRVALKHPAPFTEEMIWLFSQYHTKYSAFLPEYRMRTPREGFDRAAELITGRTDVANELIRAGLLFLDYYTSKAYGYESYIWSEYARPILAEYSTKFDGSINIALDGLKHDKTFREFLEWLTEDGTDARVISVYEEEKIRKGARFSSPFDEVLKALVRKHLVLIDFLPSRSRAGKRVPQPARWVYELTPSARRNIVPYLLRIVSERKGS